MGTGGKYTAAVRCCAAVPLLLLLLLLLLLCQSGDALVNAGSSHQGGTTLLLQQSPRDDHLLLGDVLTSFITTRAGSGDGFKYIQDLVDAIHKIDTPRKVFQVMAQFHRHNLYCGLIVTPTPGKLDFKFGFSKEMDGKKTVSNIMGHIEDVLSVAQKNDIHVTSSSWTLKVSAQAIWSIESELFDLYSGKKLGTADYVEAKSLPGCSGLVVDYLEIIGAPESTLVKIYDDGINLICSEFDSDWENWGRLQDWKDFLMWHLLRATAPFLSPSMAKQYGSLLSSAPYYKNVPSFDLLSMTMGREESFGFKKHVDDIWEYLRLSILAVLPDKNVDKWFSKFQHQVYSRPGRAAFSQEHMGANKHVLQNIFGVSTQQFDERLTEETTTNEYSIVIMDTWKQELGGAPWYELTNKPPKRGETWTTPGQSRKVLGCSKDDVKLLLHVTQTGSNGEVGDLGQRFAVIGAVIAEWMLRTLKLYLPQDQCELLQRHQLIDNLPTAEFGSPPREINGAFRLLTFAFKSFLKKTGKSQPDTYASHLKTFKKAYQDNLNAIEAASWSW